MGEKRPQPSLCAGSGICQNRAKSKIDTMLDNAIAFEALLVTCLTDMSPDAAEGEYTPEELSELAGSFPILDVLKSIDNYSDRGYHVVDPDCFIPCEGVQYSGQRVQREVIPDLSSMKCILSIAAQKENFDYDAFFR